MAIGEAMAEARKRQGLTQHDLSQEVNYSRESIAKYETGARKLPREMYSTVTQKIDDPEFYFETWGETTGYVSIPYFDGEHIDRHPASMLILVRSETQEALDHLKQVTWSKPIEAYSDDDREQLRKALLETLDAAASMVNLVATICKKHRFSMKDLFLTWQVSLKARRYKR
ncbi:helix-turn-helix domain-containing protein [Cytobacillus spongiae]|uniref:helix-turn-helix domain-containing protein n=1 Tax=Cytobacillus spongiae TaxID=2901381 RepID=UPI001F28BD23|nr:helix-turn-helix transcriptional regulator [Cytobacillus spongiae]UII56681.1 helix-turn-helix domain-containing protein [Cytobacillus spongiae]